jgi:acetyl-CoA carboxylase, biotin carboxylase subunit
MAIARMRRALEAFIVEGIETSVSLHQRILAEPDFEAGNLSTRFMERFDKSQGRAKRNPQHAAQGAGE